MDHAKLSASGSHRWIRCPGSPRAEEGILDTPNKYSQEGSLAHELAERLIFNKDYSDLEVSNEMVEYVRSYTEHLLSISSLVQTSLYIEKRVDFSHIAPEGFGTADAIIVKKGHFCDELHVIDLKYGQGAKIEAYENTQLLLYAMGALNTLDHLDLPNIGFVHLEIVQPRLEHKSKWTISMENLKYWEGYLKAKAEEAMRPNAPRIPSVEACRYCRASSTCTALYNFTNTVTETTADLSEADFAKGIITDEQTKQVLDNAKVISHFLAKIEERVYDRLLTGQEFPGYKLVNGRKMRKLKHNVDEIIVELLGEKAYKKAIVGVTELEKMLDKETLESLVYISNNRPLMVKENDKREAIILEELAFDPVEA